MQYNIRFTDRAPDLNEGFDSPGWALGDVAQVDQFHDNSSSHRPVTRVKVLYDTEGLYTLFHVVDRYVRSVCTEYHDSVCRDSCVEFFIQPRGDGGYFNFEFNCGGTMLLYYINASPSEIDSQRNNHPLSEPELRQVKIYHSMPKTVDPEITEPTTWQLGFFVPFSLFERYIGPLEPVGGQTWRGNFYKCAGNSSHPHWASWASVGSNLSFHQTARFGSLCFELPTSQSVAHTAGRAASP